MGGITDNCRAREELLKLAAEIADPPFDDTYWLKVIPDIRSRWERHFEQADHTVNSKVHSAEVRFLAGYRELLACIYVGALDRFEAALAAHPTFDSARLCAMLQLQLSTEFSEYRTSAVVECERMLELAHRELVVVPAELYSLHGAALLADQRYTEARLAFKAAARACPDGATPDIFGNLGVACGLAGRHGWEAWWYNAQERRQRAQGRPPDPSLHTNRGVMLAEAGDPAGALRCFEQAEAELLGQTGLVDADNLHNRLLAMDGLRPGRPPVLEALAAAVDLTYDLAGGSLLGGCIPVRGGDLGLRRELFSFPHCPLIHSRIPAVDAVSIVRQLYRLELPRA